MKSPTRVFIVEQDAPTLIMLALWLDQFDDIEIVGTAVARKDLISQISKLRPDVVIYNWPSNSPNLPSLVRQLRACEESPALVCIRNGNFLPLECTHGTTPEAMMPSTSSTDHLIDAIHRSAEKLRNTQKPRLSMAG